MWVCACDMCVSEDVCFLLLLMYYQCTASVSARINHWHGLVEKWLAVFIDA